jgi:putative spermidine/putrescine transport system ATP-binding protein
MLAGFETPSSGEILVNGQSLVNVPPHKRDIGMVFQRYSLFPHLNVRDNIAFPWPSASSARPNQQARRRHAQAGAAGEVRPSQALAMSGGQQQRWRSPGRWCTSRASC